MWQPQTGPFWQGERVSIIRHCEGVFTLEWNDGVQIMGPCSFERITAFVWLEFNPMNT